MRKKKKKQKLQKVQQLRKQNSEKESQKIVQRAEFYQGPLPHPAQLEHYESILPGLAERIVTMAESQKEHRHKLESRVVTFDSLKSLLGLVFAFCIVIAGIGGSIFLVMHNKNLQGWLVGLTPLLAIVGAFIYQKRK